MEYVVVKVFFVITPPGSSDEMWTMLPIGSGHCGVYRFFIGSYDRYTKLEINSNECKRSINIIFSRTSVILPY